MPEGYYSGDKPNPNLRTFVEQHIKERPYEPETDDYDVHAFDKPISTTKTTAIYSMHRYDSKKPHDAIVLYIRHYTKNGDLVLDPFCGSGGTLLATLMEGRKAIAIDRSPAATFITKNYCTPVDACELQKMFEELKHKIKPEIDWLYETRCDRCGGRATTAYMVYSQVYQCPRCLEKIPLFDCVEIDGETAKGKPKKVNACPSCHKRGIREEISTRGDKFGAVPVLLSYLCESGCQPARGERRHDDPSKKKREYFNKYDTQKILEIEKGTIPYWIPDADLSKKIPFRMLYKKDFRPSDASHFCDLYTKRNLWALSVWRNYGNPMGSVAESLLCFALTAMSKGTSRMCQYDEQWSFPYPIMSGTYYLPPIFKEPNVFKAVSDKLDACLKGLTIAGIREPAWISTQSAINLNQIPTNSIDYIFTDPPYAGKVQYGELNFIWEAWLGLDTGWQNEEIIVNEMQGKTESDWVEMMQKAMTECFRVLKPGRWLSLCYHDTSEGTWAHVQDIMAEVGFLVGDSDRALFIETSTKSYNQYVADKVNKRDLVINFRKPKPEEVTAAIAITGNENKTTFNEKVRQIIRDYIGANPGSTKDRIYDEVVSRMVRSGQMEAHDFDELLRTEAGEVKTPVKKDLFRNEEPNIFGTHEIGRWYLKETELVVIDAAENAREDAAAEKISSFINGHLKKHPGDDGVHYSDLFEDYIYAVKDKPRRQLAEFLPDYFYKTDQGTWRLPDSEEEERAKREARGKGLGRRVKRYIAQLEQGVIIPNHERPNDATLAEWIRHCKRAGLYEQGKLLYEKGGLNPENLSEEAMVGVEEDYHVCARMLTRS